MELRPYQAEAINAITREWDDGHDKTLLEMATGTGKTIVFAFLAAEEVRHGRRVLILAHRGELLEQAADKIYNATGLRCNVEKAEQSAFDDWYRITVGSIQTMMREARLRRFPHDYFDVIIVDEAHHALADSYQAVLKWFPGARVLGVTATPDRGDMRSLGQYFESLAFSYQLPQAIKDGYLCPIQAQTIPLEVDLRDVKSQAGDYQAAGLGDALSPYLTQIVEEMSTLCRERKTVVFLPLIKTSQWMRDLLEQAGFRAGEVNGESRDRAEVLQTFDQGGYDVLCNSMLLTEGWDCPSVDCIVCLRPTKIRSLYCQIVGRGTRLHPGKDNLLLLDFLWLTSKHDLCRPAHLIAPNDAVADAMTKRINEADGAVDLEQAEMQGETDVLHDREIALAENLAKMKKRKRALVDPLQFEMSIMDERLADYVPTFAWEQAEPKDKTRTALEQCGIFPDDVDTEGKAQALLGALAERRNAGLATPKQVRFLEGRGFAHVGQWPFDSANKMISRISANGWRTPAGIKPQTYTPGD